jgi:hypothetical protein
MKNFRKLLGSIAVLALIGCAQSNRNAVKPADEDASLRDIGQAIVRACPAAEAGNGTSARDTCADRLGKMAQLDRVMDDKKGLVWGGTANASFNPTTDKLTRMDSFVWRKIYLSLFAFSASRVETLPNGDKLLRLDGGIRPIAPEEYPYPFWHSAAKWQDYQQCSQVGLLFRNHVLIAAYRNARLDTGKAFTPHVWNGKWEAGPQGTRVALYTYTLSPGNPDRAALESAYRDFESATRPYMCTSCHSPANPAGMNPLVFFTHPSQALTARHEIVARLEANTMPPNKGIPDEQARAQLIALAKHFAEEGDKALAYEKAQTRPQ